MFKQCHYSFPSLRRVLYSTQSDNSFSNSTDLHYCQTSPQMWHTWSVLSRVGLGAPEQTQGVTWLQELCKKCLNHNVLLQGWFCRTYKFFNCCLMFFLCSYFICRSFVFVYFPGCSEIRGSYATDRLEWLVPRISSTNWVGLKTLPKGLNRSSWLWKCMLLQVG